MHNTKLYLSFRNTLRMLLVKPLRLSVLAIKCLKDRDFVDWSIPGAKRPT